MKYAPPASRTRNTEGLLSQEEGSLSTILKKLTI